MNEEPHAPDEDVPSMDVPVGGELTGSLPEPSPVAPERPIRVNTNRPMPPPVDLQEEPLRPERLIRVNTNRPMPLPEDSQEEPFPPSD